MHRRREEKRRTIKPCFMLYANDDGESFSDGVVAQPQGYFDSMSLQSKIGFFNRSFTLLCIAHSHCDAENLDDV